MPVQEVNRLSFGVARLYYTPVGATQRKILGAAHDIEINIKIAQKEIFAEGGYAFAVADEHRSIDITGKHYQLDLAGLANDLGAAAPVTTTDGIVVDETGVVASASYTLVGGASYIDGSLVLAVFLSNGSGGFYPVFYNILDSGSPVAGKTAVINPSTGVITFASGDNGLVVLATYEYTLGSASGSYILLKNTFQNSSSTYTMDIIKRDKSPIDGAIGYFKVHLYAVRPGSIKLPFKEGEYADYDRAWKAFAEPTGNAMSLEFIDLSV